MMLRPLFISVLALGVMTPAAVATCDISNTKCALNDGKCNIKFRNQTGRSSGSGAPHWLRQVAAGQSIKVKAVKDNGNKAGNALTIDDGASKTMNIDKKANKSFAKVQITAPTWGDVQPIPMNCEDVKSVLNGDGTCKVFIAKSMHSTGFGGYRLGYNCADGNVVAP